jgi:hypothetical protein
MNRRNVQIFGVKGFRPERKHVTISVALVFLVLIIFGVKVFLSDDETYGIPTGATTIAVNQETQAQENEPAVEEEIVAEAEGEKHPLEYGPQCAFDIINAQDDVEDVKSYLGEKETRKSELQSGYDQKKQELDESYVPEIERLERKIEEDKADLARAEELLNTLRSQCD